MRKAPVYEVKAPCKDTSFEVASGNSAPNSPKSQDPESFTEMLRMEDAGEGLLLGGGLRLKEQKQPLEEDQSLRCHESIAPHEEPSTLDDLILKSQPFSLGNPMAVDEDDSSLRFAPKKHLDFGS